MPDALPTHAEDFDAAAYAADPARKPDTDRVTRVVDLGGGLSQTDYLDAPAA